MITSAQGDTYLNECRLLGTAPDISMKRATAIMAVGRVWTVLAQHRARRRRRHEKLRFDRDDAPGHTFRHWGSSI